MTAFARTEGARFAALPFGLSEELMEYVRHHKRPGRSIAARFGVSREQIDKARVLVEIEQGAGSVEYRAELARKLLADNDVWRLVEEENQASGRSRANRRTRITHAELHAAAKALEIELRELREAKSPFEAGVKAELELNKAAQYVHAVGMAIDDLPNPQEIVTALCTLADEIDVVLDKRADTNGVEVIDGETWHIGSARAELT